MTIVSSSMLSIKEKGGKAVIPYIDASNQNFFSLVILHDDIHMGILFSSLALTLS